MLTLKKLDNKSIEKALRIISIIILCLCVIVFASSYMGGVPSKTVEWNNRIYNLPESSNYTITNDSLIITGEFPSQNVELKVTNNPDNFNKYMVGSDFFSHDSLNSTHDYYVDYDKNIGFIVPSDCVDSSIEKITPITGNPKIIEITAENGNYISELLLQGK